MNQSLLRALLGAVCDPRKEKIEPALGYGQPAFTAFSFRLGC
jgi:hypothetical protein